VVFGESVLKDAYRQLVWGPWRRALENAPPGVELRANRLMGRFAWKASPGRRRLLREHLRDALGDSSDLDYYVRLAFETHFANQYVAVLFPKVVAANQHDWLRIVGIQHLDRALERGHGAVLAHPHTALPQLPLHVLGLRGYDVHQVGGGRTAVNLSPTGQRVAELRASLESRIHAKLHDGKAYVRPLLRVLQHNGVVLTACDGTGGGEELGRREVHEVLGRRMKVPSFPQWLADRSGATLLTLWTHRNFGGGPPYVAEIAPVEGGTAGIAKQMSRWLRASPGDWHFWDAWHDGPGGLLSPPGGSDRAGPASRR
jgi:lauroyl/myristoyl acyltransferase